MNNTPNHLKIGTHVQNYKNNRKILKIFCWLFFFWKIVFSNLLLYLIQKYILNAFFRFRPSTWLKSIICQKMREFERTVFETLRGQFLLTSASKMKIGVKNRILWKMKTISLFISNFGNRMHEMLFWHILFFRNFCRCLLLANLTI